MMSKCKTSSLSRTPIGESNRRTWSGSGGKSKINGLSYSVEMENAFHKFPKDNKIVGRNPLSNIEVELNIK